MLPVYMISDMKSSNSLFTSQIEYDISYIQNNNQQFMTEKPQFRKMLPKKKVYRTYVSLSQQSYDDLLKLFELEPELQPSQIISKAIRFAYDNGLFRQVTAHIEDKPTEDPLLSINRDYEVNPAIVESRNKFVKSQMTTREKKDQKIREAATMLGATCDGKNCNFIQYKQGITGNVTRGEQSLPIRSLPEEVELMRKFILGPFATVTEAEKAYEAQQKEDDK